MEEADILAGLDLDDDSKKAIGLVKNARALRAAKTREGKAAATPQEIKSALKAERSKLYALENNIVSKLIETHGEEKIKSAFEKSGLKYKAAKAVSAAAPLAGEVKLGVTKPAAASEFITRESLKTPAQKEAHKQIKVLKQQIKSLSSLEDKDEAIQQQIKSLAEKRSKLRGDLLAEIKGTAVAAKKPSVEPTPKVAAAASAPAPKATAPTVKVPKAAKKVTPKATKAAPKAEPVLESKIVSAAKSEVKTAKPELSGIKAEMDKVGRELRLQDDLKSGLKEKERIKGIEARLAEAHRSVKRESWLNTPPQAHIKQPPEIILPPHLRNKPDLKAGPAGKRLHDAVHESARKALNQPKLGPMPVAKTVETAAKTGEALKASKLGKLGKAGIGGLAVYGAIEAIRKIADKIKE